MGPRLRSVMGLVDRDESCVDEKERRGKTGSGEGSGRWWTPQKRGWSEREVRGTLCDRSPTDARLSPSQNHDQDAMSPPAPVNDGSLGLQGCKQTSRSVEVNTTNVYYDLIQSENRLSGEINIDSIRALEEEIQEHEKIAIKLKRVRNSLLNVSKLPPEVLGKIFRWNVTLKGDFGGLEERSHNFLLVCSHWFEVASHTPELWSFWGNTPEDWARWYRCSATVPLDLVLDFGSDGGSLDRALQNALHDRANRDTIRRIHLSSGDSRLLKSIISPLTAEREGIRSNSVESLVLWNGGDIPVDVSDFFAHYRFPKLQRLDLSGFTISSWGHLASRTGALTTLHLDFTHLSPTPTTLQLLYVLASNSVLRRIRLSWCSFSDDDGGRSSFRAPLHHLKELVLAGGPRDVFMFLYRLDHPRNMDNLHLTLHNCTVGEISQTIGPYLRGYVQRRGRSQNGLGLSFPSGYPIIIQVGDVHGANLPVLPMQEMDAFVKIIINLDDVPRREVWNKAILDLIAHAPQEEIVYFKTSGTLVSMGDISSRFPNLGTLTINSKFLSTVFPKSSPGGDKEVPISLQHISLQISDVDGGDWSPLTTFLSRRASSGNRLNSLEMLRPPHMCPEVVERIRSVVQEFKIQDPSPLHPFDVCSCPYPSRPR